MPASQPAEEQAVVEAVGSCCPATGLVGVLAFAADPEDEDLMVEVLRDFFTPPRVSKQARDANYAELLSANGLTSASALRCVTQPMLQAIGIPIGHAAAIMRALFTPTSPLVPMAASSTARPADAPLTAQVSPAAAALPLEPAEFNKDFPTLGPTGFPTLSSWNAWVPGFVAHLHRMLSEEEHAIVKAVVATPSDEIPTEWKDDSATNKNLWNELVNAGSGMPDTLVLRLPSVKVHEEDGLWLFRHILRNVFTVSRSAYGYDI